MTRLVPSGSGRGRPRPRRSRKYVTPSCSVVSICASSMSTSSAAPNWSSSARLGATRPASSRRGRVSVSASSSLRTGCSSPLIPSDRGRVQRLRTSKTWRSPAVRADCVIQCGGAGGPVRHSPPIGIRRGDVDRGAAFTLSTVPSAASRSPSRGSARRPGSPGAAGAGAPATLTRSSP